MNKPDERKRGVPGRGQRRKRQRKRQDENQQHHKQQQQQQRSATANASNVNVDVDDDIKEQLNRQRKKKQQSANTENTHTADAANNTSSSTEKKDPPPLRKQMGRFRYDQERGAYFPADHNHNDDIAKKKKQQEEKELIASNELAFATSRATGRTPAASFAYPASLCSFPAKRSRLVSQWGGKCLTESATFTPSAVKSRRTDQPWHCLFPGSVSFTSSSTGRVISDLSCKSELPPWTRTFDIARSSSTTDAGALALPALLVTTLTCEGALARCTTSNNNNNNNNNSHNICTPYRIHKPCVTTGFLQGPRGGTDAGFIIQRNDPMVDSLFVRKQVDGGGGGVSGSSNSRQRYNDAEADTQYLTHIPAKVNDFVGIDDDGAVLFAAMMHGADRRVTPWSIDDRSSTQARAIFVDNFPQSEAVCVASGSNGKGSSPTAYFGHRTGEVTLFDARSSTCQSTLPRQSGGGTRHRYNEEIRTIVNIFPLTETPHYVLTRGLFDTCRLYDMRKLTNNSSSSSRKQKDPSIVHNFTVPAYASRRAEKKPSLCSGVATNPSQTFVIAPYTRADTTGSTLAIGIWSLYTGEFIGSKDVLAPSSATSVTANQNSDRNNDSSCAKEKRGPSVVELCPTITPAWAWKQPTPNAPRIEKIPGSFGLWFKSNCDLAGDTIPGEAGSIHHVFFNGRPD